MKIHHSAWGLGLNRLKSLIAAAGLGVALGVGGIPSAAFAGPTTPPAGAIISNQAAASYRDGAGVLQTALSNQVDTVIQQVGSFTLTPPAPGTALTATGYNLKGAPGQPVYAAYTITNTGNGKDDFTISIANPAGLFVPAPKAYPDANSTGQASSATPITAPVSIAAGKSYSFVVVYQIPASAGASWTDTASVSVASSYAPVTTLTRTDTVSATLNQAFSVTKAIALPAGTLPNFPNGKPASAPTSGYRGDYSVYTLTYINNGGATGDVYIKDVLPGGLKYVANSSYWSGNFASALKDTDVGNPAGISFSATGTLGATIQAIVKGVAPGASGTLSFVVQIDSAAPIGTSNTTNTVLYTPDGTACTVAASCATPPNTSSNPQPFTVLANRAVVMAISTGTTITGKDATAPSSGNAAGDGTADKQTIPSANPSTSILYTFKVFNTGDDKDTFLLGLSGVAIPAANQFPSGTTFNWYQADQKTPLQATVGKAGVDTGEIAAGTSATVTLQVILPAGTQPNAAANYYAVVQATSANSASAVDGAQAALTAVGRGVVDLTQTSAAGLAGVDLGAGTARVVKSIAVTAGGAGNNATTQTGTSGADAPTPAASTAGSAVFPLIVNNFDTGSLTFNLTAGTTVNSPSNLPAGWIVSYYSDAALTALVTDTGPISSGQSKTFYAKVTPPSNAGGGTYDVYFKATSTTAAISTGAYATDYVRDQVVVASAGSFSMRLSTTGALQASQGSPATFAHNLINTGVNACGTGPNPLTLTITGLPSGWIPVVYQDAGTIGVLDGEAPLATPYTLGSLAVNANQPLLVRVFVPNGAKVGDIATATITITDPNNPGCGTVVATDTTTVVATGQVQVTKYQSTGSCAAAWTDPTSSAQLSAKPGDCLQFKVVAQNMGVSNVTGVTVNDVVPQYTTWASTQPSTATACVSSTGAAVSVTPLPTSGASAGTAFACGTEASLPPLGTMTLRYQVQILP